MSGNCAIRDCDRDAYLLRLVQDALLALAMPTATRRWCTCDPALFGGGMREERPRALVLLKACPPMAEAARTR